MIGRPPWLDGRRESWPRRLALLPVGLLGWLYGLGASLHRALYARGVLRATRLPCRVVSVGSCSVGGSGKTPFAAWLAAELHRRGHRVALLSRGYGRRGRDPVVVVSDGRGIRATADEAGDEPLLLASHAPGVPVLVGPRRDVVGRRALAAFGSDVLVLDDGFHHHRLARDLEIVVLDGHAGLGNRRVLPRGPLREPLRAVARADAIAVIDGRLPDDDRRALEARAPGATWLEAVRAPVALRALGGGDARPLASLRGAAVGLLCGIARPGSFRRTLEALGARVVAERVFPDHHRYRAADLRGLGDEARLWLTTEKDAVKLSPTWADAEIAVLRVALRPRGREAGDAFLGFVEARLAQAGGVR